VNETGIASAEKPATMAGCSLSGAGNTCRSPCRHGVRPARGSARLRRFCCRYPGQQCLADGWGCACHCVTAARETPRRVVLTLLMRASIALVWLSVQKPGWRRDGAGLMWLACGLLTRGVGDLFTGSVRVPDRCTVCPFAATTTVETDLVEPLFALQVSAGIGTGRNCNTASAGMTNRQAFPWTFGIEPLQGFVTLQYLQ